MLVPITKKIWREKVGTHDFCAKNATEPIPSAPVTSILYLMTRLRSDTDIYDRQNRGNRHFMTSSPGIPGEPPLVSAKKDVSIAHGASINSGEKLRTDWCTVEQDCLPVTRNRELNRPQHRTE